MIFKMLRGLTPFLQDMEFIKVDRIKAPGDVKGEVVKTTYIVSASPSLDDFDEGRSRPLGQEAVTGVLHIQMAAGDLYINETDFINITVGDLFVYGGAQYEVKKVSNEPEVCDVADYSCDKVEAEI